MSPSILLAIAAALLSSLSFAGGAVVQGHAVGKQVGDNRHKERMPLSDLWALVRAPRWLAGLVLAGLGSVLNAGGLMLAPVTVVQPVGVLAVSWSVVFEATFRHRRIPRIEWMAVAQTLVGTAGFTVLAASHASGGVGLDPVRVAIGCAVVYLAAEGLGQLGARGRRVWRSFFWATGGAFFYGLESALIRTMRDFAGQVDWLQSPFFWAMALALVVGSLRGAWMIQQAFATGVSETVVGALTVTNPVVAVLFGIVVLGEGANLTPWVAFWMAVAATVAIVGVLLLSQADAASKPEPPQV
jgi:drug/metabolite transporter (DMT)-like permease